MHLLVCKNRPADIWRGQGEVNCSVNTTGPPEIFPTDTQDTQTLASPTTYCRSGLQVEVLAKMINTHTCTHTDSHT